MLARRQLTLAVLIVIAAIVVIVIPTSCYYSRVDEESLRSELLAAGILGSSPEEAANVLRRLEVPRGSDLTVGEFNATTRLLYASVSNAQRRGWLVWRARVTIAFDAGHRAEVVSVDLTADRPL
jgi:hypothetical protein